MAWGGICSEQGTLHWIGLALKLWAGGDTVKTIDQSVAFIGEGMYSVYMSGSRDYWKDAYHQTEMVAFVYGTTEAIVRDAVKRYVQNKYHRKV